MPSQQAVDCPPVGALGESFEVFFDRTRRALRVRTRRNVGLSPLPEAQRELLRLVDQRPGITVGAAAEVLQLAPNTVSTLLRQLVARHLVERRRDPHNRRIVHIYETEQAVRRFSRYRSTRTDLFVRALSRLTEEHRLEIHRAMPALTSLLAALDELD